MYRPAAVGWFIKCVAGSGLYSGVDIKKAVDVPNETIASWDRHGRARIVAGSSPVDATTVRSGLSPCRST